eukprot:364464-Chlamydomonas_euryale.AAC.16
MERLCLARCCSGLARPSASRCPSSRCALSSSARGCALCLRCCLRRPEVRSVPGLLPPAPVGAPCVCGAASAVL